MTMVTVMNMILVLKALRLLVSLLLLMRRCREDEVFMLRIQLEL